MINEHERSRFNHRVELLKKKEAFVELREIRQIRTIQQNSYVHVLFDLFAIYTGMTRQETKNFIKIKIGYAYEVYNIITKSRSWYYEKTSEMNTKELSIFIEKFRNYSSNEPVCFYLPSAKEYLFNFSDIEFYIKQNEIYL